MPEENSQEAALLRALLQLAVSEREERLFDLAPVKTEVLLATSGINVSVIAEMLGRTDGAVRKSIQRANKK